MSVPCTWSKGSMRFFSAGIYFNTTVSSPLYCIVQSMLLSSYRNNSHKCLKPLSVCVFVRCHDVPTFGCRENHSSIWESNSQESKVSSTSPRKLLCPNRSWCHTDTCRVRVSSCEWLITYYDDTEKDRHSNSTQTHRISSESLCPLTLRFSLNKGLMVLALMPVFLLLCRDISGSR